VSIDQEKLQTTTRKLDMKRKIGSGTPSSNGTDLSRRTILKSTALVLGAGAALQSCTSTGHAPSVSDSNQNDDYSVVARAGTAVVEIESGKIAGAIINKIYSFKGLPYGATTAGENRFCPAQKPKPWTGIRSSRQYGLVCPQDKGTGRLNDEEAFMFQWQDSVEGEDCLRINVWTPGINDNKKRPVMVWLHGGGFAAGSGHDTLMLDGENLARRGDVVVVSLNHRLNILGFLDLAKYGEKYSLSGNVGMLDIVTALTWVRDNISVFGGDPGRVLIFGQSGGGAKVSTLMGMPSAKGLFHRAVVQSGSFALSNTKDKSQKLADLLLAELGLGAATVDRLQALPYADLRRASENVLRRVNPPFDMTANIRKMAASLSFGPVIDGQTLPSMLFSGKAPVISADVPMIIGTTLNEFATGMNNPDFKLMTEAELEAKIEPLYPGSVKKILSAFRHRTPDAKPYELWSRIASAPVRQAAVIQATAKAALNSAPVYLYWFTWQTPIFDGRPQAFHCAELPFVFYNTDRCATMTGGGPDARALAGKVADAWIQFAWTGDPNHKGIPNWPRFTPQAVPTMMLDNNVQVELNPDALELESIT
jgi:para-nitrobenzyl esterase